MLLAYGAQSVAVEEYRPDGGREQVWPPATCCHAAHSGASISQHLVSRRCGLLEETCNRRKLLSAFGARISLFSRVLESLPTWLCPQEIFADEHAEGRVWDRCTVVAYFPPEVRTAEQQL